MKLREVSLEVLVAEEPLVLLTRADLDTIADRARRSPRRRARICAHLDSDDLVHEMIIALARGCYIPPHRHIGKAESYHILAGAIDIVRFSDEGVRIDAIRLSDGGDGAPFFYRNDSSGFHTVIVRSDVAVFHETTRGPFTRADTILAPWAPSEGDGAAGDVYLASLEHADR